MSSVGFTPPSGFQLVRKVQPEGREPSFALVSNGNILGAESLGVKHRAFIPLGLATTDDVMLQPNQFAVTVPLPGALGGLRKYGTDTYETIH